jgi:hypothetical protein
VEESRLEVRAERVLRLEPANRADEAVEIVLEALRIVGDETVVGEDEEDALRLALVALFLRLEAFERLRREEDAIDAVAATGEAETVATAVAVVDRDRRAFGERLAADANETDRGDDVTVDAADEDRIVRAEAVVVARRLSTTPASAGPASS